MENHPLLEIKNLVTSFKSEESISIAVNDISFKLNKGETMGIVGESGSGKSVTSLSIMKLINLPAGKISSGEIIFHSPNHEPKDLTKISEYEMRKLRGNEISMIFQEPMTSLNPVFTCGNQVVEAIMLHQNLNQKQAKEKAIELAGSQAKLARLLEVSRAAVWNWKVIPKARVWQLRVLRPEWFEVIE